MTLFGTPGFGPALDVFCCFPVFGGIGATLATAIVAWNRKSTGAIILSFLLGALVGIMVILPAVTHELRDTEDSRGVHAMLWQFVGLWAISLCGPLSVAGDWIAHGKGPPEQ